MFAIHPFAIERELRRQAFEEERARQLYEERRRREAYEEQRAYQEALLRQRAYEEAARREAYTRQIIRQRQYEQEMARRQRQQQRPSSYYVTSPPQSSKVHLVPSRATQQRAAIIIQRIWRTHLDARRATSAHLEELAVIRKAFNEAKDAFTYPTSLDFDIEGKLTFTAANAAVHAHEDRLGKLLTELDAISSGGNAAIRASRKAIVRDIEATLDALDRHKASAWAERQQQHSSNGTSVTIPIATPDDAEAALATVTPTTTVASQAPSTIDEAAHEQPSIERTPAYHIESAPQDDVSGEKETQLSRSDQVASEESDQSLMAEDDADLDSLPTTAMKRKQAMKLLTLDQHAS